MSKIKPEKKLVKGKKRISGRNVRGVITVRHRGGGAKRLYRIVDFKQDKMDIPGKVQTIEYDPSRSAFICLVAYKDGEKRYILAPEGIKVGDEVITSLKAPIKVGSRLPLSAIPLGTEVHNIELQPGKGGQIVRAAGTKAVILAKDEKYATLKLPSGEVRLVPKECMASIGTVSNKEHNLEKIGKAGRSRWLGRRPTVRGSAMNPVDHPHGGGEGKAPIGLPYPKTPWGKPARGVKTRKKKKYSDKYILKRRK